MSYMLIPRLFALILASVLSSGLAPAQGLSGFLNQAKEKIKQTPLRGGKVVGSNPAQMGPSVVQTGGPPSLPATLTLDANEEYTTAALAYAKTQPFHPMGDSEQTPSEAYHYCELRHKGYPLDITWDKAAIALTTDNRGYLWGAYINDVLSELSSGLSSRFGPELKRRLAKVSGIHFTTSPKGRSLDDFGTLEGYFLSFDAHTGILTAAMSQPDGAISVENGLAFTKWICKYIK